MTSTVMTDWLGRGTHAARPVTPPISAGGTGFYYETDTLTVFTWSGAAWVSVGTGAGAEVSAFLTVPASPGFDPNSIGTTIALTNSNKTATPASGSPYNYAYGTTAHYAGKWYYEFSPGSVSFETVGFAGAGGRVIDNGAGSPGVFGTRHQGQMGWGSDGTVKTCGVGENSAATITTIATWIAGNRLSFAIDIDNMLLWMRVGAGNWNNNVSADPATGTLGISAKYLLSTAASMLVWPGCSMGNTSASSLYQKTADFTQTVPTGFTSWSSL